MCGTQLLPTRFQVGLQIFLEWTNTQFAPCIDFIISGLASGCCRRCFFSLLFLLLLWFLLVHLLLQWQLLNFYGGLLAFVSLSFGRRLRNLRSIGSCVHKYGAKKTTSATVHGDRPRLLRPLRPPATAQHSQARWESDLVWFHGCFDGSLVACWHHVRCVKTPGVHKCKLPAEFDRMWCLSWYDCVDLSNTSFGLPNNMEVSACKPADALWIQSS